MRATSTAPPNQDAGDLGLRAEDHAPTAVELTPEAGAILIRIARAAIVMATSGRLGTAELGGILPRDPPAALLKRSAVFVTLHAGGELRGCIGCVTSDRPLWMTVVSAAVDAATGDPRFRPVTGAEVPSLSIDVSVLGPAVPLRDLETFRPGIDGLIVERAGRRGLLLPEVATDQHWGVVEMLDATCWKAGLPGDAWRDPRTRVSVFRTARVSERDQVGTGAAA